ncbi:hypothetical protein PIB30_005402 [Stylosanthes scabra]|uniref:Uncharacterized protein n=1 Tax=Stylosanthes scabra TaxID=79078 RepID=A0ABU6X2R6_9FABA|nr:hypothetical protein [Stylosanthes scabra]
MQPSQIPDPFKVGQVRMPSPKRWAKDKITKIYPNKAAEKTEDCVGSPAQKNKEYSGDAAKGDGAEFEANVAGESERNETIATKPRRPLLDQMRTQQ